MNIENCQRMVGKVRPKRIRKTENLASVEVLTKEETCQFLKCGMSTLPKLGLPVIRMGRSVKYLKSDLEAYLLKNRRGGSNE